MTKSVVRDITILIFIQGVEWVMRYKQCGPAEGSNSLDAELGGCAMLTERLKIWLQRAESLPAVVNIQFNSIMIRFHFCTVHLVFQFVYPAIFLYTVCFFRRVTKHVRRL